MPPKRKGKNNKLPHQNDPNGEHPGRGRKPMVRGALAKHLHGLIPEYQRDVANKQKGVASPWFTNVAKDVCRIFGWGMFLPRLLKQGIAIQHKSDLETQANSSANGQNTPDVPATARCPSDSPVETGDHPTSETTQIMPPHTEDISTNGRVEPEISAGPKTPIDTPASATSLTVVPGNPSDPAHFPENPPIQPNSTSGALVHHPETSSPQPSTITKETRLEDYYTGPGEDYTPAIFNGVRVILIEWFYYNAHKLTKEDQSHMSTVPGTDLTQSTLSVASTGFEALLALFLEQPRRAQHAQFYADKYWDTRISDIFNHEWAPKRAALESRGESGEPTVNDRMEVARRVWKTESEEFRRGVEAEVELAYDMCVREYKERKRSAPLEGQRREWNLQESFQVLQPLAEVIGLRYGSAVTIFMSAPHQDGKIETQAVHAGKTKEHLPKKWDAADALGFEKARDLFTTFAQRCFGQDEMQARRDGSRVVEPSSANAVGPSNEPRDAQDLPNWDLDGLLSLDGFSGRAGTSDSATSSQGELGSVKALATQAIELEQVSTPHTSTQVNEETTDSTIALCPTRISIPLVPQLTSPSHTSPLGSSHPAGSIFPSSGAFGDNYDLDHVDSVADPNATSSLSVPFTSVQNKGLTHRQITDGPSSSTNLPPAVAEPLVGPLLTVNEYPASPSADDDNVVHGTTADPFVSLNQTTSPPHVLPDGELEAETHVENVDTSARDHRADTPPSPQLAPAPSKPTPVYDFTAVEDARERSWWANGIQYLHDAGLGELWKGTVNAFYEHEELMEFGYFRLQYLPKMTRPKEVSDWIQSARPLGHRHIRNISEFAKLLCDWWWKIQPSGRVRGEHGWPLQQDTVAVDWEEVRFSGLNGMWSVMIALCWWGVALQTESADTSDWKMAIYDVRYVLWRLVETAPDALLAEDEPGPNSSKVRKRGRQMQTEDGGGTRDVRKVKAGGAGEKVAAPPSRPKRKATQKGGEPASSNDASGSRKRLRSTK